MSQKLGTGKTSIPIRVHTAKSGQTENQPSKCQKNRSPTDAPKGILRQRNPSGNTTNGCHEKTGEKKTVLPKLALHPKADSNEHQTCEKHKGVGSNKVRKTSGDEIKSVKTRQPSGEKYSGVASSRTRHQSGETATQTKSSSKHQSHVCKAKEATSVTSFAGKSFSETKKLVQSLQQELISVKQELAETTNENKILLEKQVQHGLKLGEDQELISNLSAEVKLLQERLFTNENDLELLGLDPVSKEKLQREYEEQEHAREAAVSKALELKEQLLLFTENNRQMMAVMQEMMQVH